MRTNLTIVRQTEDRNFDIADNNYRQTLASGDVIIFTIPEWAFNLAETEVIFDIG